jgi:hypothetical protein
MPNYPVYKMVLRREALDKEVNGLAYCLRASEESLFHFDGGHSLKVHLLSRKFN